MHKTQPPEQDVDQLLGAFFKSEIPDPFPPFEPPVRRTLPFRPAPERRRFVLGSRLALAASVALLMVGGWLLSGSFSGPAKNGDPSWNPTRPEAKKDKGKHNDVPIPDMDLDKLDRR
jgi:hypothetical protein